MVTFTVKVWVLPRVSCEGGVMLTSRALTGNGEANHNEAPTANTKASATTTL